MFSGNECRCTWPCDEQVKTVELRFRDIIRELKMGLIELGIVGFLWLWASGASISGWLVSLLLPRNQRTMKSRTHFWLRRKCLGVTDHEEWRAAILREHLRKECRGTHRSRVQLTFSRSRIVRRKGSFRWEVQSGANCRQGSSLRVADFPEQPWLDFHEVASNEVVSQFTAARAKNL